MSERYARQALFSGIGNKGQASIIEKTVALIGCGALGCTSANMLVRSGIKRLRIIDRDYIEESNLQRQLLFDEDDITQNLPKAVAAQRKLQKANSRVTIDAIVADLNPSNIEVLLEDAHLIIDGSDNFETRFLINDYSVKQGIPWIYGACVGSRGVTMNIVPQRTPCLRCVLEDLPSVGTTETCDTEGIIAPIAGVIASIQVAEALKILTNNPDVLNTGLLTLDLWQNKMTRVDVKGLSENTGCITCKRHTYEFLSRNKTSLSTILCGRGSVQILPQNSTKLDLAKLAERLKRTGGVTYNSFLLRLKMEKYELAVFPDGRSIISGTNDPSIAKGLYAKYLGM